MCCILYNRGMKTFVKSKKTSTQIKNTFMELLKDRPIEKITVREICNLLHINRSTFYRHYEDIYFLYREIVNDLVNPLKKVYKEIEDSDITSVEAMKRILVFIKENKEIYSILMIYQRDIALWENINTLSIDLFLNKIYQKYENSMYCDQNELKQSVQFVTSGFYALYKSWLNNNCGESIDVLARRLSDLSDTCIEQVINKTTTTI